MHRRKFLQSTFGGLALLCVPSISSLAVSNEQKETKEKPQKQLEKPLSYKTIDEVVIKNFLGDFLDDVTPKSKTFQRLREKYDKKGILERYCSGHRLCLDLAFNAVYQNKEISNKDYELLGKQLSIKQDEISKEVSRIKYLDKGIEQAFGKWSKLKTENFQRLLSASKEIKTSKQKTPLTKEQKEDYIKQLHNIAYPTKKEYEKYVKKQNKSNKNLYTAMKKTLKFGEALIGGGEISRVRKTTDKSYSNYIKRFFGDKK